MSAQPDDVPSCLRALRAAVARCYGVTIAKVKLYIAHSEETIKLIIPGSPAGPDDSHMELNAGSLAGHLGLEAGEDMTPESRRERKGLAPCVRDILAALRRVKKPLTKTRLLEELWRDGHEWSESSVINYLKILMDDGTIENIQEGKDRGYRLTESAST